MGKSNIGYKVVLIIGARSGIADSTVKLLAYRGAKVVVGARRKDRRGGPASHGAGLLRHEFAFGREI